MQFNIRFPDRTFHYVSSPVGSVIEIYDIDTVPSEPVPFTKEVLYSSTSGYYSHFSIYDDFHVTFKRDVIVPEEVYGVLKTNWTMPNSKKAECRLSWIYEGSRIYASHYNRLTFQTPLSSMYNENVTPIFSDLAVDDPKHPTVMTGNIVGLQNYIEDYQIMFTFPNIGQSGYNWAWADRIHNSVTAIVAGGGGLIQYYTHINGHQQLIPTDRMVMRGAVSVHYNPLWGSFNASVILGEEQNLLASNDKEYVKRVDLEELRNG